MSEPVRIAYLVGYYPKVSHTFITREVDGLRARGLDVQTFSLRRTPDAEVLTDADRRAAQETYVVLPPDPGRMLRAHGRAFARRPMRYLSTLALALRTSAGGLRNGLWQAFYFAEAVLLADEFETRGIDHVHAHFANAASAVAMLAAHLRRSDGLTWSFTMHGPTEFDDVTLYALAEKVRRASFVAVISEYARSQLMKLVGPEHWGRLEIVHCGVDPALFAMVDRSGRTGPMRVLNVGRLVPDKGQGVLLEAISLLESRGVEVTATLVGDGPDRAALESAASTSVSFVGSVGQDRIRDLYAEADAFCLPSFAEGVPVVLMEAMATGLPVVSTRIAGIPELVEDGLSGLLVAPGRADVVADALERLAADPGRRPAMGAAGRERVLEGYDVADGVERLIDLFAAHSAPRE